MALAPLFLAASIGAVAAAATGLATLSAPCDPPKERGLHTRPTPTSGGVAILLAVGLGVILTSVFFPSLLEKRLAAPLILASLFGVLGLVDDMFGVPAKAKLALQALAALIFCACAARVETLSTPYGGLGLGPLGGVLGSALWIVVAINAVNFMDGVNGLAAGALIIAEIALGLAAFHSGERPLAALSFIAAAAGAGFLPWNLPGGRIFQGDCGALFSGGLFAGLVLVGAGPSGEAGISVWFGPLALLPLLTDVFLTLLSRARRGLGLLDAHREHLFQRWLLAKSRSHVQVALRTWRMMMLAGTAGLIMLTTPVRFHALLFAVALACSIASWMWTDRQVKRSG